jgi:cysteine-rich repeat protein
MAPRFLLEAVVFLFFANLPACSSGGRCGDGRPASGEGCDDGNVADGDGCSAQCLVEEGYTCLGAPSVCTRPTHCGDGLVEEDEECDDNNTTDGDGCSAECLAEKDFFCSGAPSSCVRLSSCGNGQVESPAEKCDDGNRQNGDGCNFLCQVEPGFDCLGEPSACRLSAAAYYVRADGGDDTQCDGRTDAAYPGSGQNQPCAWKHPFYALDQRGVWKLKGGEALIIGPGSYRMGLGAPGAERFCSAEYPWDCQLPSLPPGPDAAHPTRLLGAGYASGCQQKPELWGAERAYHIVDLSGSSNTVVDCLEITDHSSCALSHCTASVACPRETGPYGDYADVGVLASDAENLVLRRLDVHGLAAGGVHAARLRNFTMEKVRIAGNGSVGFDGDLGEDSSNSGLIRFQQVTVEWNGCPEQWPDGQNNHCWGQNVCGGYGDGVGVARSGGRWLLDGCVIRYNTSDGLDLLYVGVNRPFARVEVRNSVAYGNAGNQFKVGE